MSHRAFTKELEEFRGCQFMYLRESQRIEELVQSYLESPELHSLDTNQQLLYYLLNSEYAPLQRFARTGLQPDGFWVRTFPRVGPWIVYAGIVALWVFSILYALFSHGSIMHSIGVWVLVLMITGFTAYYLRGWLRLKTIAEELRGIFDCEIAPGHFDPTTLGNRLYALKQKGLRVHPNVFALLQLHQHLQNPTEHS